MGDRATIRVNEGARGVSLYTHWGGHRAKSDLAAALDRGRGRWGDAPYLARIIFCEMVGDDTQSTTGYGIWVGELDGFEIHVDVANQLADGMPFEQFIQENKTGVQA